MRFTFVLPSNRVENLRRSLDSLVETTHDLSKVQVVVAVDKEDKDKFDICSNPPVEILLCEKQDGFSAYFNKLLPLVKGDAVWIWSDENIMNTPHWDKIVEKAVRESKFKDVWYGTPCSFYVKGKHLASSLNPITKKMFSCFPVISKQACDALGYIMTPKLRYWGADLYMNMLFDRVGRVIPMENLIGVLTERSDDTNKARMAVYREDLDRLVEKKLAKINANDSNIIEYNLGDEMRKLRDAMVTPRFHRL